MNVFYFFFFFKQKTAYELRISDWSSDVCSSDLLPGDGAVREVDRHVHAVFRRGRQRHALAALDHRDRFQDADGAPHRLLLDGARRGEEIEEGGGAAVHGRDLGAVDLDPGVVDDRTAAGRHQVLDGGEPRTGTVAEE